MDLLGTKFGRGPRELGGSVDLINHFKLWPHHEFFCKRSLPSTISDTPYLHNVVGETKIKKGEGMELDQLFQNTSYVGKKQTDIHPFDLCVLREAFQMRETTPADLPYVEKGIPTEMLKLSGESKDKKKHKNQKSRDKEKNMGHKRRPSPKNSSRKKYEEKVSNGHHDFGPENLQKLQEKKRKFEGSDDLSSIQRRQKTELKNLKINHTGTLRIVHTRTS